MSAAFSASILSIACASSRDNVAKPGGGTGDASDGLRRDDSFEIPCEPRRILTTVCQQCHTRPSTKNGAPFPLQWRSDVLATYSGIQIRELMIEQLSAGRMPLSPVTIDPADRETLLAWLRDGAPAVTPTACLDGGLGGIDAAVADASQADDARDDVDAGSEVIDPLDAGDAAEDDANVEGDQ